MYFYYFDDFQEVLFLLNDMAVVDTEMKNHRWIIFVIFHFNHREMIQFGRAHYEWNTSTAAPLVIRKLILPSVLSKIAMENEPFEDIIHIEHEQKNPMSTMSVSQGECAPPIST